MAESLLVIFHRLLIDCFSLAERQLAASVADGSIGSQSPLEHAQQHWHFTIDVIEDSNLGLVRMNAMQPAGVLDQSPLPGNGHGQEERIESCVIKTLSDIAACCEYEPLLSVRNLNQARTKLAALFDAHSTLEDHEVTDETSQLLGKVLQMIPSLGKKNRRTTLFKRLEDIVQNQAIAWLIVGKRCVDILNCRVLD